MTRGGAQKGKFVHSKNSCTSVVNINSIQRRRCSALMVDGDVVTFCFCSLQTSSTSSVVYINVKVGGAQCKNRGSKCVLCP